MLPHFNSFSDFLQMGGYAIYVWPAYGICALLMLVQAIAARKKL